MIDRKAARPRRWTCAFGSSAAAIAAVFVAPAWAQCSPDPTTAGGTSSCTGVDPDGFRVTTNGSTVQVAGSASVMGAGGPAISVDIPYEDGNYGARKTALVVSGRVDGSAQSGIAVLSGPNPSNGYDFYGSEASIAVDGDGIVTGATGIIVGPSDGNIYAQTIVKITNGGTINGTSGVALRSVDPARAGFASIDNAEGGTIGAIIGTIGYLTNAGVIDGGSLSAIDQTSTYNNGVYPGTWVNSGTIKSASTSATIANLATPFFPLTNSGTIANSGTGAAVQGRDSSYSIAITNLAGGTISSAGGTAIVANALTLINAGTIKGDVLAGTVPGTYFSSSIDSSQGMIEGNVRLSGGNNLVYGRYDGTTVLVTGITGTLDPGTGTNSFVLAPSTDLTVSTAITLPMGFQSLRLEPAAKTTLTLTDGFVAPGPITLTGAGTVLNQAAIKTNGQAFVVPFTVLEGPRLINTGSIDATPGQYYTAIDLSSYGTLNNSGTITSSTMAVTGGRGLTNSGTIEAVGTAVYAGSVTNSGTIRSTQGVGAIFDSSWNYAPAVNSGLIEGATYGALVSSTLNNSGTIRGTGTGTGIGLSNYAVVNNLAGGVISGGGTYAIIGRDPYGSTNLYNGSVFNAGTINGDVSFVAASNSSYSSSNMFVALTGGVLNGNLTLGRGDTLVADLVNTGPGQFAGINGTVTTSGGLLRYRVSGEASALIGAVGPFASTGYELVDGARLTLTAGAPQSLPVVLAGKGMVDLTTDVALTNQTALTIGAAAMLPGTVQDGKGLTVVSRGTLSGETTDYFGGGFGVVLLGANNMLQNEGTIRALYSATNGGTSFNAAVAFGTSLTNNGRIELDGSYGTYNVDTVVNMGTIVQTGPRTSYAIRGANIVTNSGTMQTAGAVIQGGFGTFVTNSGTIASTGSTAIFDSGQIVNLAGGTIIGGDGNAIQSGGVVSNAGSIIGNVDLRYGYGNGSAYFANGGTVAGDVILGNGGIFLQNGEATGVSGAITAGAGRNIYGRALTSSGTVAIGPAPAAGFQDAMIAAMGPNTVATLSGVDTSFTDLYVAGDGTVINQVSTGGRVIMGGPPAPVVGQTLGTLINAGSLTGGVSGSATRLVNTGTIAASGPDAISIWPTGVPFTLDNSGHIEAKGEGALAFRASDSFFPTDPTPITLRNSGTILGSLAFGRGDDLVENSGNLTGSINFGGGNDLFRLTDGEFAGSIAGGVGSDAVEITGGRAVLADVSGVEMLRMSAGLATVTGLASFGDIELAGGRLVGNAGSTITAPSIFVGRGATFGSAGTVNGNAAIAGTLSPGASPGTMTVNGNVALATGSISLFELSSGVSDKLVVNGTVSIAPGSTLQIVKLGTLRAGTSYNLIEASGGITGSYATVVKPSDLIGFLIQRGDRISLMGQFLDPGTFGTQISRSIAYANNTLAVQGSTSGLLDALPSLLTASGEMNPQAFARLTPEPYASATQMAVDSALTLVDIARGPSFATTGSAPHLYSFAATLGQWHRLGSDAGAGTAAARTHTYGLVGGLGFGNASWSVGAFGGYINNRQNIDALSAQTKADGILVGIQGRMRTTHGFGLAASVLYDGSQALTTRTLPVGSASGQYDLHSWTGDLRASYEFVVPGDWALRTEAGVTYIRTTRDGLTEVGSPFALTVARNRHFAGFGDGTLSFGRSELSDARFRPFVSFGVRYQIQGVRTDALGGYAGGGIGLDALGASRARVTGTVAGGLAYRVSRNLDLFASAFSGTGREDHRESVSGGARFAF